MVNSLIQTINLELPENVKFGKWSPLYQRGGSENLHESVG